MNYRYPYDYDFVRVFDGNSSEDLNLLTELSDWYTQGWNVFPSNVSSSSNELHIIFSSNEQYRDEGFKAKIYIEPFQNANLSSDACSLTSQCNVNQGHCQSDDECQGYLKCGHNNCPAELGYHNKTRCCYDYCSQWLDMENGILTSPWYPQYYPGDFRCRTLITVGMTVAGPRTITLEFLQFKVSRWYLIFLCSNTLRYSSLLFIFLVNRRKKLFEMSGWK